MKTINDIPKNVHDRLEYLEFMLRFRGWVSRMDLIQRFELGEAAATRDIRLYRDFAEPNLFFNQKTKKYDIVEATFKPLFELKIQAALSKIRTARISEALGMSDFDGVLCPPRLSLPKLDTLSTITRAISGSRSVNVTYRSIANGLSDKQLIPHAIFDNGIHWYMRAYDSAKDSFRDYALTRIVSLSIDENAKASTNLVSKDYQWNRMVTLELVPHPNKKNVQYPETVEHDFDMKDGYLKVVVRATVAGYWLQHWSVDCTEDHSLKGYQYQLWLRNHNTLYDVVSRKIAPGLTDYFDDEQS